MRLDDLLQTVTSSTPSDWQVITPVRVERIRVHSESGPEVELAGHAYLAHYKPDLSIGLAWGAEGHPHEWTGVYASWSPFPDKTIYAEQAEVLFQGRPVVRQLVVSADGGRYCLPAPHPQTADGVKDPSVVGWYVEAGEIPLARLIHELGGSTESFDSGMQRAGFEVR